MEQAAAVMTRLATNRLQMSHSKPVTKFCELFGVAHTEYFERTIYDSTMMSSEKRGEMRE